MARVILLILDSFGIGASLDAKHYGDEGADTLGHIAEFCEQGKADNTSRQGPLTLPNMTALGLQKAALASTGKNVPGLASDADIIGRYGYCVEQSLGKDTPSGHWEIAGLPVMFNWTYFPKQTPCFPDELINEFIKQGQLDGILGNCHASGTVIINELGEEHIKTGKPIVYTSGDSVFQIAAHEEHFGLEKLYQLCGIARELVDDYQVGRVIARPFVGESGNFTRTGNRRDYATPPPADTLLDKLIAENRKVIAIGKTADIFAHRGISEKVRADGNMALFDATLTALESTPEGGLIFTNFVDFDSHYGHRRDITGYAEALEAFDARLPELIANLQDDDLLILSADHGCDPSFPGSDHTREHIPVLCYCKNQPSEFLGRRETFADIGQSIAKHLKISPLDYGVAF